jgi:acetyl-CoA acetyltransferase family protein
MSEVQRNMSPDHNSVFSVPFPDYILDAPPVTSMTQTAQNVAEVYGLSREEMDEFSVLSHKKAVEAYERGVYKDEVIPLEVDLPVFDNEGNWVMEEKGKTVVFDRDECIRPGTNIETLSQLKTVNGIVSYGNKELMITAGNSCPTNDGISAVLLMSEDKARELGLTPIARVHTAVLAGADPVIMLTAPIPATQKALAKSGLSIDEIGAFEVNEAFAPVPLAWLADIGADAKALNPNGGAIALGHPLGGSGARLMTTLVHHMRDNGIRYGLQTMCEGGGQANATILELL